MTSKSIMQNIDENAKKKMQEALKKYKQDKNSVKEFYPCTQQLTIWLKERAK